MSVKVIMCMYMYGYVQKHPRDKCMKIQEKY